MQTTKRSDVPKSNSYVLGVQACNLVQCWCFMHLAADVEIVQSTFGCSFALRGLAGTTYEFAASVDGASCSAQICLCFALFFRGARKQADVLEGEAEIFLMVALCFIRRLFFKTSLLLFLSSPNEANLFVVSDRHKRGKTLICDTLCASDWPCELPNCDTG